MAKIPLPDRGQPLDVTYIYDLANAVNDMSSQISSATFNYTSIDNPNGAKQNIRTSQAKIIGGYIVVANNSTVNAGNEKEFEYDFGTNFKYPPIVTATAVNINGTPAGQNVTVILKPPTSSRVEGVVRFNASGDLSIAVNLIIIGIPN